MSGLVYTYNSDYVPIAFGLRNSSSICYFNSLMQSLLSCPAFNEHIMTHKETYKSNTMIQYYISLLEGVLQLDKREKSTSHEWRNAHLHMIRELINIQQKSKFKVKLGSGMQDAGEGLNLLLDTVKDLKITELFQVRYSECVLCRACNFTHQAAATPYLPLDITLDIFEGKSLDEHPNIIKKYICKHDEDLDENYICPKKTCEIKGDKYKYSILKMIPEIIVILFKNYINKDAKPVYDPRRKKHTLMATTHAVKKLINFPMTLSFNDGQLEYKIVSQCEHNGSLSGGHYWAISRRKNGIFNLNDTGVSTTKFTPTEHTYMLFYHIVDSLSEPVSV